MCHPSKNLHGNGKSSSNKKQEIKRNKASKKSKAKQVEKPCEAQLFFLQNEDVLY
jgi:hypothetical protein